MRSRHCGYNSQCYITVLLLLNLSIIQAMNWLLCCVIGFKELHLSPGWSRPFCFILAPSLSFCLYHAALLSYSIDSSVHPLHSKAFFFFFFFHLHLLHPLLDLLPCGKKRGRKKRQKEKDYFFFFVSLKTCNSLPFLHHISFVPVLSLLMPANSCHGDGEVLGGVWLQMLEEVNTQTQTKSRTRKTNKGAYSLN